MMDSSKIAYAITEDVRILEVDGLGGDWVGGVEQHLSLPVELDGVGGLVDAVGLRDDGAVFRLLHFHSCVLLAHILDVVHREPGSPSLQGSPRSSK